GRADAWDLRGGRATIPRRESPQDSRSLLAPLPHMIYDIYKILVYSLIGLLVATGGMTGSPILDRRPGHLHPRTAPVRMASQVAGALNNGLHGIRPEVAQKFHSGSQLGLWAAFMYAAAFAARSGCWAATFVVSPGSSARLYSSGVASGA